MTVCTQREVGAIVSELTQKISRLYPMETPDVLLFGSYARGEADDGSDIDVIYLVDAPREVIARRSWQVGSAAAEILLEHGVLVSPIVENREYYYKNAEMLPFFRNIQKEGVKLHV